MSVNLYRRNPGICAEEDSKISAQRGQTPTRVGRWVHTRALPRDAAQAEVARVAAGGANSFPTL